MTKRVTLIDYGVGNLLSVSRAFEACGVEVELTSDASRIAAAERIVLPGVGAFADGMRELEARGLVAPIRDASNRGIPLLGICLGMQMLFSESDEHQLTPGLDIIPGRVQAIPNDAGNGKWRKTPHIGWNTLLRPVDSDAWDGGLFDGLGEHPAGYFVHSFSCVPTDRKVLLAECDYEGVKICAAVRQGKVFGCQFHPEKSGAIGLGIIRNFIAKIS